MRTGQSINRATFSYLSRAMAWANLILVSRCLISAKKSIQAIKDSSVDDNLVF